MVYFMGALFVKLSPASLLVLLEKLGGAGTGIGALIVFGFTVCFDFG